MSRSSHSPLFAAIDLGSNTALLIVARQRGDGTLEVVDERCETPRLGAGLSASTTLDPAARARALDVLVRFRERLRELDVEARFVRAVGTACLRRATDGADFAREVRDRLGLPLEVLSPEDEARASARGVEASGAGPEAVVIDVGGGSTEVACRAIGCWVSVPIGAVLLAEQHLREDPPRPQSVEAMWRAVESACAAFPQGLAAGRTVFAVGGSAVNLACLASGASVFDPARAEGVDVDTTQAREFARQSSTQTRAERRRSPVEADRVAILPAGLALLTGTCERLGASHVRVSGRGLRHGLVLEGLASLQEGVSGSPPLSRF